MKNTTVHVCNFYVDVTQPSCEMRISKILRVYQIRDSMVLRVYKIRDSKILRVCKIAVRACNFYVDVTKDK